MAPSSFFSVHHQASGSDAPRLSRSVESAVRPCQLKRLKRAPSACPVRLGNQPLGRWKKVKSFSRRHVSKPFNCCTEKSKLNTLPPTLDAVAAVTRRIQCIELRELLRYTLAVITASRKTQNIQLFFSVCRLPTLVTNSPS